MFGRLSQLAQNVQQSFNADDSSTVTQGSPSKKQDTDIIESLRAQLEEAEERNKNINAAFKKLLKEKEEEIKSLKNGIGGTADQRNEKRAESNQIDEEALSLLKRKAEEYQMLIEQKDESINMLMHNLKETEDLKDKIEEQERKNTEKLMFELAERINAHETIQRKMEEMKQVMNEKDNAVHNMADQMAAQEELLKAREESIRKLKRMATGGEASEEMISTLQKVVQSKDSKIIELSQNIDKLEMNNKLLDAKINNRDGLDGSKDQTIESLWAEIRQKNDMLQKFASEKDELIQELQRKDQELKAKHDMIFEKETVVDELNLKLRSMERELNVHKSESQLSTDENAKEISNLKNQIVELKEMLKSKTQTIDMFEKEMEDKDVVMAELIQKQKELQLKLTDAKSNSEQYKLNFEQESHDRKAYKEKYENEIKQKNQLKEQLDEVGRQLSSEVDLKTKETKGLEEELSDVKEKYREAVDESKRLIEKLNECQEQGQEKSKEYEHMKHEMEELKGKCKCIENDLEEKSIDFEVMRNSLTAKDREIEDERNRFTAKLRMIENKNENENGLASSQLMVMEKELESTKEELKRKTDENNKLQSHLTDVSKFKDDLQNDLKVLKGKNADLGTFVENANVLADELKASKTENQELMKKLEESIVLQEDSERQFNLLKEECSVLTKNAKEMENAMDHMVEKLNHAELKMNESMQEQYEVNEKLHQVSENNKALLIQKTEIETALEEFVKCTESRKKRSGKQNVDEPDGTKTISNEGHSGYSTPVSKESSPRNSAYIESNQPINVNLVGSSLEGKAIGDIFRLVEEERNTLEARLSSVAKERDLLAAKANQLEDYFEMEKQKFKQASEEIKKMQLSFDEGKDFYEKQLASLQAELSSLKRLQEEYESNNDVNEANIEKYEIAIENLDKDLRRTTEEINNKSLELNTASEVIQSLEKKLADREQENGTTLKQNRQLKSKLKELLKEKSKTDSLLTEKQASLDEAEKVSSDLRESVVKLESLKEAIDQRDARIKELEEDGDLKSTDVKKLRQTIHSLEDSLANVEENMKSEIFEANERQIAMELSIKDQEEIIFNLKSEIDGKDVQISELISTVASRKEEISNLGEQIQCKEKEALEMQNMLKNNTDVIKQMEKLNSSLQSDLSETNAKLSESLKMVTFHKSNISNDADMISNLQNQISSLNSQLSAAQEKVHEKENEIALKSNHVEGLQGEIERLTKKVLQTESEFNLTVDNLSHDLSVKTNDLANEIRQREALSQKMSEFEILLTEKNKKLDDISDAEGKLVDELREESKRKHDTLLKVQEEMKEMHLKVAQAEKNLKGKEHEIEEVKASMANSMEMHASILAEKDAKINELERECNEKDKLLDSSLQKVEDLENNVIENKKSKDYSLQCIEELQIKVVSLENENEKQIGLNKETSLHLNEYLNEINHLRLTLQSESEKIISLSEEAALHRERNEVLANDMELLSQERDLLQQQNASMSKQISKLEDSTSVAEQELESLRATNENIICSKNDMDTTIKDLKQQLLDNKAINEAYLIQVHDLQQTLDSQIKTMEELAMKNNDFALNLEMKDREVLELESKIEKLNNETAKERELPIKQDKDEQVIETLTMSLSEKDDAMKEINEAYEKQSVVLEELRLDLSEKEQKCSQLQSKIEALEGEHEQSHRDSCIERESLGAKLEELKTNIKHLETERDDLLIMFQKLNENKLSQDEKIDQLIEDLNLISEENTTMKQALEEKTKAFEDFKGKALKKMKLMKEESKKLKTDADDMKSKQDTINKLEEQLESANNDKQSIFTSMGSLKEKMAAMENSNQNKEETIKAAKDEISKMRRLIENKSEEALVMRDMLSKSMEELESIQSVLSKREEKIKILQDQLIANEEDMTISFTEKEKIIEDLHERVNSLEVNLRSKELECSDLHTSMTQLSENSMLYEEQVNSIASLKNNLQIAIDDKETLVVANRDMKIEFEEELKIKDAEHAQLLEEIASKDAEITNLISNSARKDEPANLAELYDIAVTENREFKAQIDLLKEEMSLMTLKDEEKHSELDLLHEQLSKNYQELETLKSQHVETSSSYTEQIYDLQTQLEKMKKSTEDYKSRASKKIKALKEENKSLNESSQDIKMELEKQTSRCNELTAAIDDVHSMRNADNEEFEVRKSELSAQLQANEITLKEKDAAIQFLNDELIKINEIAEKKENLIQKHQEELKLEHSNKEESIFNGKHDAQQQLLQDLQDSLSQAEIEIQKLKFDIKTKNQEIEQLTDKIWQHQQESSSNNTLDIGDKNLAARNSNHAEESDIGNEAIQLKLAKAIKRIGKLKKDLQAKDETIHLLKAEISSVKPSETDGEQLNQREQKTNEIETINHAKSPIQDVAENVTATTVCFLESNAETDLIATADPNSKQLENIDEVQVSKVEDSKACLQDNDLLEALRNEIAEKQENMKEISQKHSKAAEMLEKAKRKIALLKKSEAHFRKENASLQDEVARALKDKADIESFSQEQKLKMNVLDQKIRSLEDDLGKAQESRDKLNAKNGDLKKLIEVMAEEKHDLDGEMKDILNEIKEVMDIKTTLMSDLEEANEKLARAENDCNSLKEIFDEREKKLQTRIIELDEQKRTLEESYERKNLEVDEHSRETDALRRECQELKATLIDMQLRIDHETELNTELQGKLVSTNVSEDDKAKYHALNEMETTISSLEETLMEKNAEMEKKEIAMQHLEMNLKNMLDDEIKIRSNMEKEIENLQMSMNNSVKEFNEERLVYQTNIDELRSSLDAEKESMLHQEISLLQSKFDKEREIMGEKLKIEKEELVRSFNEEKNLKEEMQQRIDKLVNEKEHKETIIVKLKLKLKQTMKDRDVIKSNSQSEIERLSQEKDMIFNEFQTKMQQIETDCCSLKEQISDLESTNANLRKDIETKDKMADELLITNANAEEKLKNSEWDNREIKERIGKLQQRMSCMETEIEKKEEIIEKYEWETSEKEDRIRLLERDLLSAQEDSKDMDELKSTLDETISVKEHLIEDLQNQLETCKKSNSHEMNLLVNEMADLKKEYEVKQKQEDSHVKEIHELELKVAEICKAFDMHESDNVLSTLMDHRKKYEERILINESDVEKLKNDKDILVEEMQTLEAEINEMKEEKNALHHIISNHIRNSNAEIEESASLETKLELLFSKSVAWRNEKDQLNELLNSLTKSHEMVEHKCQEQERIIEEIKSQDYEARLVQSDESLNESRRQCFDYQDTVKKLQDELTVSTEKIQDKDGIINEIITEKENLELKLAEIEYEFQVTKLEVKQLKIDRNSSEKQMESLLKQSESVKSTELAELESAVAIKNKSMLNLREDFSQIVSDKDDIIVSLRSKIDEMKYDSAETQNQLNEEIMSLKTSLEQKDNYINKLTGSLSSLKKNSDWLKNELSHVIKEKNSIGGSIQNQFESISKGLRSDIELFMEDKKNVEAEFQIEKLQLERTIAEQQSEISRQKKKLYLNDKKTTELNHVIQELQLRIESAADTLSKESYYKQLEEKLQTLYDQLSKSNGLNDHYERKQRELEGIISELEINLRVEKAHKEEIIIDKDRQLKAADDNYTLSQQLIRDELRISIEEEKKKCESLQTTLIEIERDHKLSEAKIVQEMSFEIRTLNLLKETLESKIESLQTEQNALRDEIMNEALSTADEKMLKLKVDFDKVIVEKDTQLTNMSDKVKELNDKVLALSKSNVNLSESIFCLEADNNNLQNRISSVESYKEEQDRKHKEEVKNILSVKGKDFTDLRSQFDEALADKEDILQSLRSKVSELRNQVDTEHEKSSSLKAEKEKLSQQEIRNELLIERLKVNIDSLLNSMTNLDNQVTSEDLEKLTFDEQSHWVDNTECQSTDKKEERMTYVEDNIYRARRIIERYLQFKNNTKKQQFDDNSEIDGSNLKEVEYHLNDMTVDLSDSEQTKESSVVSENTTESERYQAMPTMFGVPRIVTGLQILASEALKAQPDSEQKIAIKTVSDVPEDNKIQTTSVTVIKSDDSDANRRESTNTLIDKITEMQSYIKKLERANANIESEVRKNFDDILKNLREDLQSSQEENNLLQAEVFMLKNLQNDGDVNKQPSKHFNTACVQTDLIIDPVIQTDIPLEQNSVQGSLQVSNGNASNAHSKSFSSSERLPEVVEDTLVSKMAFEQFQTHSDSSLEGETVSDYAKLELRLTDEPLEVEKAQSTASLLSELETYKSKFEQSSRIIIKLKQLSKKYKNELNELQIEKFEQIRAYEDEMETTKQEIEQRNTERHIKDQEIRSLREEVKVLVKEKSDMASSAKTRIEETAADYQSTMLDLREKQAKDLAIKDETILILYNVERELKVKIEDLENQLCTLGSERDNLQNLLDTQDIIINEQRSRLEEFTSSINKHEEIASNLESNLLFVKSQNKSLEERLFKDSADCSTENPCFDERIINQYDQLLTSKNNELENAVNQLRAMQESLLQTKSDYEMKLDELTGIINAHEETIERMNSDKVDLEKSMHEMRDEVKNTVEERNDIVSHWKSEANRLVEENTLQYTDVIERNISAMKEQKVECDDLQNTIVIQKTEMEKLKEYLNKAELRVVELEQQNEQYKNMSEDSKNELELIMNNRHIAEDQLTLYKSQIEAMENENNIKVNHFREDIEKAEQIIESTRKEALAKEGSIATLCEEIRVFKQELDKSKRKSNRLKRELDSCKHSSQELGVCIRQEMENVINEVQDEKNALYSQLLSKENTLQEARMYADQLAKEKDKWIAKTRNAEIQYSDAQSIESKNGARDQDVNVLSFQVQQLRAEKDLCISNFEKKLLEITENYTNMEKLKRKAELEIAELKVRLQQKMDTSSQDEGKTNKSQKVEVFGKEVRSIRGEFENLKRDAANFTLDSKNMLIQLEHELTGLIMHSVQGQNSVIANDDQHVTIPTSTLPLDLTSLSSDERLDDNNADLYEAKERIGMLEESLCTWRERCVELENEIEFYKTDRIPINDSSQEFLINIEEDEGPSIETARAGLGQNIQRLMKYSTSGMKFNSRARSFFRRLLNKQRGPIATKKILLMTYLLVIHVMVFLSVYWLISG